jgi:hypothetical protein
VTSPIARPTFYEGEILPAADLGASVDYARNQMARHSRYLHSWGIATGLELTPDYVVKAGIAIDGTGREVIVPADYSLDPTQFNVFPPNAKALCPVFLYGVDQPATPSSNLTGACGNGQSTSMQETYQITFGSPGSELQVANQTAPAITDPPDGGTASANPWLILLGYVTWSGTAFTSVASINPSNGIGPQYVGVNASQVISGSGSLLLATDPATPAGPNPVMAIELQESPTGGTMVFGTLGTDGTITPALKVTASGDVSAMGKISGTSIPLTMQVQSGIASDGMILPLPTGIGPSATNLTIQAHVSLRYDALLTPPPGLTIPVPIPLDCTVDPTTQRVSCRLQWFDASNWTGPIVTPATCDYLVVASISGSSGGDS